MPCNIQHGVTRTNVSLGLWGVILSSHPEPRWESQKEKKEKKKKAGLCWERTPGHVGLSWIWAPVLGLPRSCPETRQRWQDEEDRKPGGDIKRVATVFCCLFLKWGGTSIWDIGALRCSMSAWDSRWLCRWGDSTSGSISARSSFIFFRALLRINVSCPHTSRLLCWAPGDVGCSSHPASKCNWNPPEIVTSFAPYLVGKCTCIQTQVKHITYTQVIICDLDICIPPTPTSTQFRVQSQLHLELSTRVSEMHFNAKCELGWLHYSGILV